MISELAEVVSKERAMIEECEDLLSKAHLLQVYIFLLTFVYL